MADLKSYIDAKHDIYIEKGECKSYAAAEYTGLQLDGSIVINDKVPLCSVISLDA